MSWDDFDFDDFEEPDTTCVCGKEMILPRGNKNSKWLFVGEFPGKDELEKGKPFVGASGWVLQSELRRLGYDLGEFRIVNILMHENTGDERCRKHGIKNVIEESSNKDIVILVGSETCNTFTDYNVSDVSGLVVESPYFKKTFAMYSPAVVFHESVGEIRFALENLIKEIKR